MLTMLTGAHEARALLSGLRDREKHFQIVPDKC